MNLDMLNNHLETHNIDDFLFDLGTFASNGGMSKIAERAGLTREGLYKILCPNGNPRMRTLISILSAMGISLSVSKKTEVNYSSIKRSDGLFVRYPILKSFWNGELNTINPDDLRASSRKIVYWSCSNEASSHTWQETPAGLLKRARNILMKDYFGSGILVDVVCPKCDICQRIKSRENHY